MKRITLLVAFTVLTTAALARQDPGLSVRQDGVIPEHPPAYRQTRLHITFSQCDAGASATSYPLAGRPAFGRLRVYIGICVEQGLHYVKVPTAAIGPRLPTWALQQVVSFLGYTGRAANVAATAESDPKPPCLAAPLSCCELRRNEGWQRCDLKNITHDHQRGAHCLRETCRTDAPSRGP
jgi:hypothetical protein